MILNHRFAHLSNSSIVQYIVPGLQALLRDAQKLLDSSYVALLQAMLVRHARYVYRRLSHLIICLQRDFSAKLPPTAGPAPPPAPRTDSKEKGSERGGSEKGSRKPFDLPSFNFTLPSLPKFGKDKDKDEKK